MSMKHYPNAMERLTEQFGKLPGIGGKTAQRLAFFVLSQPEEEALAFAQAIVDAKKTVKTCPVCQNLTDSELCPICADPNRDKSLICVVTDARAVLSMEKVREFKGVYHVLHGLISPMNGVTPDHLKIKELLARVGEGDLDEVIVCTNPTVEGEATAMYLSRLLRPLGVKVTRLAYGVPMGSDLEYADEITLFRAIEGRRDF